MPFAKSTICKAMSDSDSRWPTTTPEARLTSGSEKVSVRDALGPGTRLLEEFEVLRVLGTGGFGIVYLARDHVLQRDIAIKEYMPAALARRGEGATVALRVAPTAARRRSPRASNRSSAKPGCSRASTIRRWSRCIASGGATPPPTWRCRTTRAAH